MSARTIRFSDMDEFHKRQYLINRIKKYVPMAQCDDFPIQYLKEILIDLREAKKEKKKNGKRRNT